MCQSPSRSGGRSDGDARSQAKLCKAIAHITDEAILAPEQMRDSGHIEAQPIRPIHLDHRRPAAGPFGEALNHGSIALGIGRYRDQRRVERTRVGQPRSGPGAALGCGAGDGMDDGSMRAFDGENDGIVRR